MELKRHYYGTDFITGLRAIAVFLVFLIHSGGGGLREMNVFLNTFVDFGKYGVQIFFVISGFTIFHQLNDGKYSLLDFLMIRISRISIPYFPIIFFIFIYVSLGGYQFNDWANLFNDGRVSLENLIIHFTYIFSVFDLKYQNTIIGVEWTLNIEVFFYCVIGFLLTRNLIKKSTKNMIFWLTMWLGVAFFYGPLRSFETQERIFINWMPFIYGYMFILGGIAFFLRGELSSRFSIYCLNKISDFTLIISIPLFMSLIFINTNGMIYRVLSIEYEMVGFLNGFLISLLTSIIIITTRDSSIFSWLLKNKVMLSLGSISYSFYLIHYIIISSLFFETASKFDKFTFDLLTTIVISLIWYEIFEKRIYQKTRKMIIKISEKRDCN